jgi:hypothetical protein
MEERVLGPDHGPMLTDRRRCGAPSFRSGKAGQAKSESEWEVPMHAIVVHVKIDPSRKDEAERMLHEDVVPMVKQAPGLVNAYWLLSEDDTEGFSVILFDDKDAAQKAVDLNPPQPPADSPVQLAGVEIHEVIAQL